MSEYNETPWYANGHAVYMGADGGFSLRCCPNPEANARHIVHCVNNHERLTWLLAQIIQDLPANRDWLDPEIEREARTLLAKLEAEKGGEL